jgi:ketosteroid isomerase-like protein
VAIGIEQLAERFKAALESADLDSASHLFAPDVCWGPPEDPDSGCHNRDEVLAQFRVARELGLRAKVTEILAGTDCLLVGLSITSATGADERGDPMIRWQVLSLKDGVIADIRGYDEREPAASAAHIAG